jgi:hypothetical protein
LRHRREIDAEHLLELLGGDRGFDGEVAAVPCELAIDHGQLVDRHLADRLHHRADESLQLLSDEDLHLWLIS